MTKDWAAVATAVSQRMTELGLRQHQLVQRSRVSRAAVSEIQHNVAQRRRSARTLEALSVALNWHPHHLIAILEGRTPPQIGDPVDPDGDAMSHLNAIERRIEKIANQLDRIEVIQLERIEVLQDKLDHLVTDLSTKTPL